MQRLTSTHHASSRAFCACDYWNPSWHSLRVPPHCHCDGYDRLNMYFWKRLVGIVVYPHAVIMLYMLLQGAEEQCITSFFVNRETGEIDILTWIQFLSLKKQIISCEQSDPKDRTYILLCCFTSQYYVILLIVLYAQLEKL